jgi:hypothetical protein
MMQVIPFQEFMIGSTIVPSMKFLPMLDGGLTFFVGTGACLLGLIALEKMGLRVNEQNVRFFVLTGAVLFALWAVFKNPLFRSLTFGF